MKKIYSLGSVMMLALMLASLMVYAQPVEKTIIFVGQYEPSTTNIRPEDQVAIDSISQWISNLVFMDQGDFNTATADELYGETGTGAVGVIFSESIGSNGVYNFALRDNYPVPVITMEEAIFSSDLAATDKWPLLIEGGGIWGFDPPEAVDVQWKIAEDMHYVTEEHSIGDVVTTATAANRGVPYLHGLDPYHIILATGARADGGDYIQAEAIALGYVEYPEILIMNVPYTHLSIGTPEFYALLHRSVKFMFEAYPVGIDQVLTKEFGLSVYPNPATRNTVISFSAEAGKNVSIDLYSLTGALVGNVYTGMTVAGENVVNLNTERYGSGLYLIELQIENKVSHAKFILK